MRSPHSALLLVPMLLASALPARAQPSPCQAGAPHLELSAAAAAPAELCIHPGRFTTFLFDTPLAGGSVVLEGREHFRVVEASDKALLLVPGERLPAGARLQLEVGFADGQPPERAAFTLVAHPAQAAHQVEVSRAKASESACQARAQRLQAQLEQCGAPPQGPSAPPGTGLLLGALLAQGKLDERGLALRVYPSQELSPSPEAALEVQQLILFRSLGRLALQARLRNQDPQRPWRLEGAALIGADGKELALVGIPPVPPLEPGATRPHWAEWVPPLPEDDQRYTLRLWSAGRARTLTVPNLRLP